MAVTSDCYQLVKELVILLLAYSAWILSLIRSLPIRSNRIVKLQGEVIPSEPFFQNVG